MSCVVSELVCFLSASRPAEGIPAHPPCHRSNSPVWLGLHWAGCTTDPNEHAEPEWGVCASENSPTPKRKLLLLGFRVGLVFIGIQLLTKLTESLLSVLIRLCASGREMIHVRGCVLKFAMTFVCLFAWSVCLLLQQN